jgi:hypothetical protein
MTKQEKIQEAYGEWFEEMKPWIDEDGWFNKNAFYQKKFGFNYEKIDILFSHLGDFMIPKSILGITNNNGWTVLNSEDDLPKETDTYWFVSRITGKIMKDYFTADSKVSSFHNCQVKLYSYYQRIEKPQPPIY